MGVSESFTKWSGKVRKLIIILLGDDLNFIMKQIDFDDDAKQK